MPNGSVYVFNVFSEEMTLFSTNGKEVGEIAAWSSGGGPGEPLAFTPAGLVVGRVLNASDSPAHFWNGKNRVILQWPSGIYTFVLAIDGGQFPITQNLVLYIQSGLWQLFDPSGVLRQSGPLEQGPALLLKQVIRTTPPER